MFGPIHPLEAGLVKRLSQKLSRAIPAEAQVVCPLAIGGHVDHRLTRAAAEAARQALLYYLDFPYVFREPGRSKSCNRTVGGAGAIRSAAPVLKPGARGSRRTNHRSARFGWI
ncbi:MAG: hypothetical protein M5U05_05720 [Anaerolineales bacterium]|nr:hypothetical protein [Anaerolineales bacterium]